MVAAGKIHKNTKNPDPMAKFCGKICLACGKLWLNLWKFCGIFGEKLPKCKEL